jgi:hypothetical protein
MEFCNKNKDVVAVFLAGDGSVPVPTVEKKFKECIVKLKKSHKSREAISRCPPEANFKMKGWYGLSLVPRSNHAMATMAPNPYGYFLADPQIVAPGIQIMFRLEANRDIYQRHLAEAMNGDPDKFVANLVANMERYADEEGLMVACAYASATWNAVELSNDNPLLTEYTMYKEIADMLDAMAKKKITSAIFAAAVAEIRKLITVPGNDGEDPDEADVANTTSTETAPAVDAEAKAAEDGKKNQDNEDGKEATDEKADDDDEETGQTKNE